MNDLADTLNAIRAEILLSYTEPQKTAQAYAEGFFDGEYLGERELAEGLGNHHGELAQVQEYARNALTRETRAYELGWLRGYRESVRTLRAGRWGT